MGNKRARADEVVMDTFMEANTYSGKKRRFPVHKGLAKRHISASLDPRLHTPHYPDPFRPLRPVTQFYYHFPAVPTVVVTSFLPETGFEPMDWEQSVYSETVIHVSEPETPMEWE
uniref:Uncharacterized protein n=1 Tax=Branchiostoma floridae TaxID=7739 RepID=C3Y1Z1_BRAFL|eukprot:XP_002609871.1 hypothetical protein BRAFLDRAFT_90746 [Branchiostoma floridae]